MTQTDSKPIADANALQAFQWTRQPIAQLLLLDILADFLRKSPPAATLSARMTSDTGTRFFDWIDHLALPDSPSIRTRLADAGYLSDSTPNLFHQPQGMFPRILLHASSFVRIVLKVESVADFLAANPLETEAPVSGEPLAQLRSAVIARNDSTELVIAERHGWPGLNAAPYAAAKSLRAVHHLDLFRRRQRHFSDAHAGFAHANHLADAAIADLGIDWTCSIFFAAEREFWQRKNRAAQVQKARQDRLGLGWANHDHHTYRSSRACFKALIAFFEKLGCECRERFYAGKEAGWGAQVMENPGAGIITFNDVDLAPEELFEDFAHQSLAPRAALGTVGLWCGLHGEAFLEAGMHHLECQFDFQALKTQLETQHNIPVMKAFTDYPFLRQAFTEGERWPVRESQIQKLLLQNLITPEQAERFRQQGAIGSHLENLERNEGYKGFNQKGVSEVISATDPRLHVH